MALQTTGPISFSEITNEVFGSSGGTTTLTTLATQAGYPSGEISFSDFYGLGLTEFASGLKYNNSADVCSSPITFPIFHDGAGSIPVVGDTIYFSRQSTHAEPGFYKHPFGYMQLNNNGEVTSIQGC